LNPFLTQFGKLENIEEHLLPPPPPQPHLPQEAEQAEDGVANREKVPVVFDTSLDRDEDLLDV